MINRSCSLKMTMLLNNEIAFSLESLIEFFPENSIESFSIGEAFEIDFSEDLCLSVSPALSSLSLGKKIKAEFLATSDASTQYYISIYSWTSCCNKSKWNAFRNIFFWLESLVIVKKNTSFDNYEVSLQNYLVGSIYFAGKLMSYHDLKQYINTDWSLPLLLELCSWNSDNYETFHSQNSNTCYAQLSSQDSNSSKSIVFLVDDCENIPINILRDAQNLVENSQSIFIAEVTDGEKSVVIQRIPVFIDGENRKWNTRVLDRKLELANDLVFSSTPFQWSLYYESNWPWDTKAGFHPLILQYLAQREFVVSDLCFDANKNQEILNTSLISSIADLFRNEKTEDFFQIVEKWLESTGGDIETPLVKLEMHHAKAYDGLNNEFDIACDELMMRLEASNFHVFESFFLREFQSVKDSLGFYLMSSFSKSTPGKIPRISCFFRVDYCTLKKILNHSQVHAVTVTDIPKSLESKTILAALKTFSNSGDSQVLIKQIQAQIEMSFHGGGIDRIQFYNNDLFGLYIQNRLIAKRAQFHDVETISMLSKDELKTLLSKMQSIDGLGTIKTDKSQMGYKIAPIAVTLA